MPPGKQPRRNTVASIRLPACSADSAARYVCMLHSNTSYREKKFKLIIFITTDHGISRPQFHGQMFPQNTRTPNRSSAGFSIQEESCKLISSFFFSVGATHCKKVAKVPWKAASALPAQRNGPAISQDSSPISQSESWDKNLCVVGLPGGSRGRKREVPQ